MITSHLLGSLSCSGVAVLQFFPKKNFPGTAICFQNLKRLSRGRQIRKLSNLHFRSCVLAAAPVCKYDAGELWGREAPTLVRNKKIYEKSKKCEIRYSKWYHWRLTSLGAGFLGRLELHVFLGKGEMLQVFLCSVPNCWLRFLQIRFQFFLLCLISIIPAFLSDLWGLVDWLNFLPHHLPLLLPALSNNARWWQNGGWVCYQLRRSFCLLSTELSLLLLLFAGRLLDAFFLISSGFDQQLFLTYDLTQVWDFPMGALLTSLLVVTLTTQGWTWTSPSLILTEVRLNVQFRSGMINKRNPAPCQGKDGFSQGRRGDRHLVDEFDHLTWKDDLSGKTIITENILQYLARTAAGLTSFRPASIPSKLSAAATGQIILSNI